MNNIVVLTSSRADYGILRPLLKLLDASHECHLQLIIFGSHLSKEYGSTVNEIISDGYHILYKLDTLPIGDKQIDIIVSMAETIKSFASIWNSITTKIDLVIGLGDRYEMFAAILSTIHFDIDIAHIHGGETTLGALDNKYRHFITIASSIHFCSTQQYYDRVVELIDDNKNIFNVGALGLDNLLNFIPFSIPVMKEKFGVDFSIPTLLVVYHPETVNHKQNDRKLQTLIRALTILQEEYQIVINYPNADITGIEAREALNNFISSQKNVHGLEHFGTQGYFSAISHSLLLIGNSSSGIIEAASLNSFVLNIGDRQKGRAQSNNTFNVPFDEDLIVSESKKIMTLGTYNGINIYQSQFNSSASRIFTSLQVYLNEK
ncbi:MAG: UDP-N-acetylglucosamine 2-epimerase [Saprospiraceae bacterium]